MIYLHLIKVLFSEVLPSFVYFLTLCASFYGLDQKASSSSLKWLALCKKWTLSLKLALFLDCLLHLVIAQASYF